MSFADGQSELVRRIVVCRPGVTWVESGLAFEDANQIAEGTSKLNDGG
jgi:hypothetical protein